MALQDTNGREPWRKLLDPIREDYQVDNPSDLEMLWRVVYDHQALTHENGKLNRIVTAQAKVLRRHGLAGY